MNIFGIDVPVHVLLAVVVGFAGIVFVLTRLRGPRITVTHADGSPVTQGGEGVLLISAINPIYDGRQVTGWNVDIDYGATAKLVYHVDWDKNRRNPTFTLTRQGMLPSHRESEYTGVEQDLIPFNLKRWIQNNRTN